MKNQTSARFTVPDPCTMQWDEMKTVTSESRHCSSCDRVIVDFSKMSDEALLSFFSVNKNVCGRFAQHQLNRTISDFEPVAKRNAWKNIFMLPALFLSIGTYARQKQNIASVNTTINAYAGENKKRELIVPENVVVNDSVIVDGTVLDSLNVGIYGAVVILYGTWDTLTCVTGQDGKFKFNVPDSANLSTILVTVNETGYWSQTRTIRLQGLPENIQFKLTTDFQMHNLVMGISLQTVSTRRYGFFYRLFHPRRF